MVSGGISGNRGGTKGAGITLQSEPGLLDSTEATSVKTDVKS